MTDRAEAWLEAHPWAQAPSWPLRKWCVVFAAFYAALDVIGIYDRGSHAALVAIGIGLTACLYDIAAAADHREP